MRDQRDAVNALVVEQLARLVRRGMEGQTEIGFG